MKIAFLAFTSIPKLGGAQVFAYNLAHNLSKKSHEIHFYLPRKYYKLISRLPIDKSIKFKSIFFIENAWVSRIPQVLYWSLLIRQIIYRYDVWQVIGVYPAGFISRKLSSRVPVVLRAHGDDIQKDKSLDYGLRLNGTIEKQIKSIVNEVTSLVAITNTVSDCYRELGVSDDKIIQIPNGIESDRFSKPIDRKKVRDQLGILENEFMILSVGRCHKKKGYDIVLDTARILLKRDVRFKWILVGRDVDLLKPAAVKMGVVENFRLLKEIGSRNSRRDEDSFEVPSAELISLYRSSDIFVLASLLETFGMVLIEAMAACTPVVTTDAPGCRDVVSHEFNGLLATSGDPQSLADNIEKLITNNKLRRQLCSTALMDVIKYDYSNIANQYLDLYQNLCHTH